MDTKLWLAALMVGCLLASGCSTLGSAGRSAGTGIDSVPVERPDFSHAAPMVFDRIVGDIANDTRVGYELYGLLCVGKKPVAWRADGALSRQPLYSEVFRSTLAEAGFPNAKKADLLFKSASNHQRKDLVVGAVITHIDVKVCYPLSGTGDNATQKGKGTIQITWQIYSSRQKEVVFEAEGIGVGKLPRGSSDSVEGVILAAFTDGAKQLMVDPAFVQFATTYESAASKPLSMIRMEAPTPYQSKAQGGLKKALRSVATVLRPDGGHGSGFLIGSDGWMLTNHHVAGDLNYVTVRLMTGREVSGQVVRADEERDVALIKLEGDLYPALPVRATEPDVGTEIYAIGSPLEKNLHTTLTRGIVSAYRNDNGKRLIQSDVNIQGGNSGGPVVDEDGNLVAISVSGIDHNEVAVGINFFIPIHEALRTLELKLDQVVPSDR